MTTSIHVTAFKPPGEKWRQMKAVHDACQAANIEIPREVWSYFNNERPDPAGVAIDHNELADKGALARWRSADGHADGYDLDVTKLPADVTLIRFYNSW